MRARMLPDELDVTQFLLNVPETTAEPEPALAPLVRVSSGSPPPGADAKHDSPTGPRSVSVGLGLPSDDKPTRELSDFTSDMVAKMQSEIAASNSRAP